MNWGSPKHAPVQVTVICAWCGDVPHQIVTVSSGLTVAQMWDALRAAHALWHTEQLMAELASQGLGA